MQDKSNDGQERHAALVARLKGALDLCSEAGYEKASHQVNPSNEDTEIPVTDAGCH